MGRRETERKQEGALADEDRDSGEDVAQGHLAAGEELARRLTEMGLPETERGVQVKINRGAFPAWFLLAALTAIGASSLRLDD